MNIKKTEHREIRGNREKSRHLLLLLDKTKESTKIRRKSAQSTEIQQNLAKSQKTLQNQKNPLGIDENPDIFPFINEDEGNCANPEHLQNPGNSKKCKKSEKIQQHPDNPGKSAEIEDPDLP